MVTGMTGFVLLYFLPLSASQGTTRLCDIHDLVAGVSTYLLHRPSALSFLLPFLRASRSRPTSQLGNRRRVLLSRPWPGGLSAPGSLTGVQNTRADECRG